MSAPLDYGPLAAHLARLLAEAYAASEKAGRRPHQAAVAACPVPSGSRAKKERGRVAQPSRG